MSLVRWISTQFLIILIKLCKIWFFLNLEHELNKKCIDNFPMHVNIICELVGVGTSHESNTPSVHSPSKANRARESLDATLRNFVWLASNPLTKALTAQTAPCTACPIDCELSLMSIRLLDALVSGHARAVGYHGRSSAWLLLAHILSDWPVRVGSDNLSKFLHRYFSSLYYVPDREIVGNSTRTSLAMHPDLTLELQRPPLFCPFLLGLCVQKSNNTCPLRLTIRTSTQ
jgi:hypothetical protein